MNAGEDRAGVGQQPKIVFVEWPVDEGCLAYDVLTRHEAPLPGVGAVATVVPHDEVLVRPYDAVIDGWKRVIWIILVDIWFVQRCAIHGNLLPNDAEGVTRNCDDALHIVQLRVQRVFEDDDVPSFGCMKEVSGFVDEDVFLVVQRWFHTGSLYAKVLHGEAQDEKHE